MWCLTTAESTEWSTALGLASKARGRPIRLTAKRAVTVPLSNLTWSRLIWFGQFVASSVEPFENCLLWVIEWGVWSSSENWHLFYRLRESYGERRPLHDAPGHLFLRHETADLATFVELALLYGWDFYLVPNTQYMNVFASHDEFIHFHTNDKNAAERVSRSLIEANVECTSNDGK